MTLRNPAFSDARTWPAAWDRFALELSGLQSGVFGPNDMKVTAAAAGGQRVDIAAGTLLVKGDSGVPATGLSQGLFAVVNDGALANAVTLAASNVSLPRIDQIVVRVRDTQALSGGGDDSTFMVLTGTATSGATLDNRNGAAALPADYERLADVLVPASSTAVAAGNIRDRRGWARGGYSVKIGSGAGNYMMPGGSATTIPGDPLLTRMECSGAPLEVDYQLCWYSHGAGSPQAVTAYPTVDGVKAAADVAIVPDVGGGKQGVQPLSWSLAPSAGSRRISIVFDAFTSIEILNTGLYRPRIVVREMVRQSASN